MKISALLKYIVQSASYGVLAAVILILLVPDLRTQLANSTFIQGEKKEETPLSYAKAVSLAGPAVVNIYSVGESVGYGRTVQNITDLGSGVIMDSAGYILTNYHVVENADLIEVWLQSGQKYHAVLIGYDVLTDLAVLKVDAINLPVILQRENLESSVGDVVLAIGNPLNLGQTVTQGVVSGVGRNGAGLSATNYTHFLQMDAAINAGNSGGALINTVGELVGINSRVFKERNPQLDIQGISFAVPYQLADKVMRKIIEHGRVVRGWLGVQTRLVTSNTNGFLITGLAQGGPAHVAGLKTGDFVYQIEDIPVTSMEQALDLVAETPPGTILNMHVIRENKNILVPVHIVELNIP